MKVGLNNRPQRLGVPSDQILNLVPADRRQTLIAKKGQGSTYRFDIRMQGDGETVFFEV